MKKVTQKMINDFDRAYSILADINAELTSRGGQDGTLYNLTTGSGLWRIKSNLQNQHDEGQKWKF